MSKAVLYDWTHVWPLGLECIVENECVRAALPGRVFADWGAYWENCEVFAFALITNISFFLSLLVWTERKARPWKTKPDS